MSKQSGLNPNVHGARGLFSLVIFFYHVGNSGLPTFPGSFFVGLQQAGFASLKMGVELFFGISGLVIVGALGRASSFVSFLWDRVTRILPVLWATILVITAMSFLSGERLDQSLSLRLWLANFLAPPLFSTSLRLIQRHGHSGTSSPFIFCWARATSRIVKACA